MNSLVSLYMCRAATGEAHVGVHVAHVLGKGGNILDSLTLAFNIS